MVNSYSVVILKSALKDKEKIKEKPALKSRVDSLLEILRENPYQNPPSNEKLRGDFRGLYSRRINNQHRLIYKVLEKEKTVMIVSMWTHYGEQ
jgi:Txe/YoeB family toxin of toxin-antitoxin system